MGFRSGWRRVTCSKSEVTSIDTHPLPDFEILEMQWALQRLVSMSGAAGWVDLEDRDSDSTLNGDECLFDRQTVSKWVADTAAYKSDQYAPFGDLEESPGGRRGYWWWVILRQILPQSLRLPEITWHAARIS